MRLVFTLVSLASLAVAPTLAQQAKKPQFRTVTGFALAGKTATVQVYGQDLSPTELRFQQVGLTGKVLKAGAFAPKSDEERRRGNTVVDLEVTAPAGLRPGYYPFMLVQGDQSAAGRLLVDIEAPEMAEVEPNNTFAKPQALPPGSVTVTGKLDNEGADVFQIQGQAGEAWRFEVFAKRLTPASKLDAVLRVRDPRRAPLRAVVDQGDDCSLELKLPRDGPYLLELFDGDNRSGGDFTYRLAVRRLD
jgi:hypothetical protein